MSTFIAEWQDVTGVTARRIQRAYDNEADAQAYADAMTDAGQAWVIVYEGPEVLG